MREPMVSIITVNYNGVNHLKELFESIKKTKYENFETIFVDNGSTDQSVEFVRKNFDWVRIVETGENLGAAGGANAGIEYANGKYFAFINTDVKVDPYWLKPMVEIMEKDSSVAACTSKILLYKDPKLLNAAGFGMDIYGFVSCRGLIVRGHYEIDKNQYNKVEEVFGGMGTSLLARTDVMKKIGNFNSDYFMYHEDVDVCWRMRLAGYKILYVPSSIVLHKIKGSTSSFSINWKYYMERNRLRILLQNYEIKTLIKVMPPYVFLKSLEMAFYFALHNSKVSILMVKAWLNCLINSGKILKERKFVQEKVRKIKDEELMKIMKPYSIEFSLFSKGFWKSVV